MPATMAMTKSELSRRWELCLDVWSANLKINGKYYFFKIAPRFDFFYTLEISDNTGVIFSDTFETVEAAKAASEGEYCGLLSK